MIDETSEWGNEWEIESVNEQTIEWLIKEVDQQMNKRSNGWINGRMSEQLDD
jgi:hypothetical protein